MKVLFTCVVGHGHFNPMVPLARALEAAGHRVAFATDPGFCGHVRDVGFEAYPAGLDQPEAQTRFVAATPGWADIPPADRMPFQFPGLFAGVRAPRMVEDLEPLMESWRPDLVIHETAELAGAIVAESRGIAHAEHSFGIVRAAMVRAVATEVLAPIAARLESGTPASVAPTASSISISARPGSSSPRSPMSRMSRGSDRAASMRIGRPPCLAGWPTCRDARPST